MKNLKHVLVCGNGFDLAIGRKTSIGIFTKVGIVQRIILHLL